MFYCLSTLEDKYNWDITCKQTFGLLYYRPIRNYKLLIVDDENLQKGPFLENVVNIKLEFIRKEPSHRLIQNAIYFFRELATIDVSSISTNKKQAMVMIKLIPENTALTVGRGVKKRYEQNVILTSKQICIQRYDAKMKPNHSLLLI